MNIVFKKNFITNNNLSINNVNVNFVDIFLNYNFKNIFLNITLKVTPNNVTIKWFKFDISLRNDNPFIRDFVIKSVDLQKYVNCMCGIGESVYFVIAMEVGGNKDEEQNGGQKERRRNYERAVFSDIRFDEGKWSDMEEMTGLQQKYDFLNTYEMGVRNYVPICKIWKEKRNVWFNTRCETGKQKRDRV